MSRRSRIARRRIDPRPSTLDPRPSTLDPRPSTLDPRPSTLDPRPSTALLLPQKGSQFTKRYKEPHAHPKKLSKSLCDPTQNQWISSPFLRPTARYFAEILTDQISFVPDNFLKRREGCSGQDSKTLYACLASLRTTESKA